MSSVRVELAVGSAAGLGAVHKGGAEAQGLALAVLVAAYGRVAAAAATTAATAAAAAAAAATTVAAATAAAAAATAATAAATAADFADCGHAVGAHRLGGGGRGPASLVQELKARRL